MADHVLKINIQPMMVRSAFCLVTAVLGGLSLWLFAGWFGSNTGNAQIGQTREQAEAALGETAFFGRTCFGELAVFTDRERDGVERHVMAILDENTRRVKATETQIEPVQVADGGQCSQIVLSTARASFPTETWRSASVRHYNAGASQRYFLKSTEKDGRSLEIWGDFKDTGSSRTCELFSRESLSGEERLLATGEWTLPATQNAVAFDATAKRNLSTEPGS